MNRQARRASIRKQVHADAIRNVTAYVPENVRLEQQEAKAGGGGVAGWRLYKVTPETLRCIYTGRINRNTPVYTIPRRMPTGTWPVRLDKKIP